MPKRLGLYLSAGFVGVVLLLAGLSWDAVLHAGDPTLAAREGIFAWRNPGHVLLGLGMGTVIVSLLGAASTAIAMSGSTRWGRPVVQRAFLAGSTALVVTAATVTSWAASATHEHHAAEGAAAHGHAGDDALSAGGHAPPGDGPATPGHGGSAAVDHHAGDLAAHTDTLADGDARTVAGPAAPHGHAPTSGPGSRSAAGAAAHDHGPSAGPPAPEGAAGGDHASGGSAPDAGDHSHPAAPAAPDPAAPDPAAPQGGDSGPPTAEPDGARVATVRWGPFVLPPAGAGGDMDHTNVVVPEGPKPCSGCFMVGVEPDLVYADGTSANLDTGVMLHHAVFFQAGETDTTCGGDEAFGRLGRRIYASGNERTGGVLPAGFGVPVTDRPWNGVFHIMNHGSTPRTVFFQMKIRWVPGSDATTILPVTPVWLDMNNCRTSEYAVPAGPSSRHWTWTSTITGRIVSTGGHVHDGGIRTTLSNATSGQRICTSWAGYGTKPAYQGTIESMSVCAWDALGTVRTGEVLDLETVYDAAEPLPDAMGIMLAYVYETGDLGAGTAPPPHVTGDTPAPPTSTPPPSEGHPHGH